MVPLGVALAAFVFLTRPDRTANRLLAAFIFLETLAFGSFVGLSFLWTDAASARASASLFVVLALAGFPLYIAFYGTLDTPLAKPLRSRTALLLAVAYALVGLGLWYARPDLFFPSMVYVADAGAWVPMRGPLYLAFVYVGNGTMYAWGLVLAISAWRRARAELARRRALAYALAFGVHDGFIALYGFGLTALGITVDPRVQMALPIMEALFFLMLAYGLVQTQLFDIDLRIKRGLRSGTVAAAFVAAFFVASELASTLLADQYGTVAGVVVAGGLVFLIAPLQRAAERLADTAMPRVADTPEYRVVRSRALYRAAVESALQDGRITDSERSVLATLAQELGIGAKDALDMEREAAAGRAGVA